MDDKKTMLLQIMYCNILTKNNEYMHHFSGRICGFIPYIHRGWKTGGVYYERGQGFIVVGYCSYKSLYSHEYAFASHFFTGKTSET